jgi:hypothetical protein
MIAALLATSLCSAAMEYERIELGRRAGGVTRPEQKAAR